MLANSDWPLERLQQEHGAQFAYRVHPSSEAVSLEGRHSGQTVWFRGEKQSAVIRRLLPNRTEYALEGPTAEQRRAGTVLTLPAASD